MRQGHPTKFEYVILSTRRVALTLSFGLVGLAIFDKLVTLLGARLLDVWYPFGAGRC